MAWSKIDGDDFGIIFGFIIFGTVILSCIGFFSFLCVGQCSSPSTRDVTCAEHYVPDSDCSTLALKCARSCEVNNTIYQWYDENVGSSYYYTEDCHCQESERRKK